MKEKYSLGDLSGPDGNAFFIMGKVHNAMLDNGYTIEQCNEYFKDATSGNYEHLVDISQKVIDRINALLLIRGELYESYFDYMKKSDKMYKKKHFNI